LSGSKNGKIPSPVNHGFQILIVHIGYIFQLHIIGCNWVNQSGFFKKSFRFFITHRFPPGHVRLIPSILSILRQGISNLCFRNFKSSSILKVNWLIFKKKLQSVLLWVEPMYWSTDGTGVKTGLNISCSETNSCLRKKWMVLYYGSGFWVPFFALRATQGRQGSGFWIQISAQLGAGDGQSKISGNFLRC
jgi:hypothetical protein